MRAIKIDKDVPLPNAGSRSKWPFPDMEVGDSFLVPKEMKRSSFSGHLAHWQNKLNAKFITRTTPEGVRIWRIK